MRKLFPIMLCTILVSGCSCAVRQSWYLPVEGGGWDIVDNSATYACGEISLSLVDMRAHQLVILGPLVPVVPIPRKHPSPLVFRISGSGHDTVVRCPRVSLGGAPLEAYKKVEWEESSYCNYKMGRDFVHNKTVTLSFLSPLMADDCAVPDLPVVLTSAWGYTPFCAE